MKEKSELWWEFYHQLEHIFSEEHSEHESFYIDQCCKIAERAYPKPCKTPEQDWLLKMPIHPETEKQIILDFLHEHGQNDTSSTNEEIVNYYLLNRDKKDQES